MRILLVTGADGATFARSLAAALPSDDVLDVLVPTVHDHWTTGLRTCPALDTHLTGDAAPTFGTADALGALGYSPAWHRPSDAHVALAVARTDLLGAGYPLTDVTAAAATRLGLPYGLVPQSDDRAELRVVVDPDAPRAVPVAQYLADPDAHEPQELVLVAETWGPSAGAVAALAAADVVVLGPAGRTLVVDPVLRTPGLAALVPDDLPVLRVDHPDDAPPALVAAAGLGADVPGTVHPVPSDVAAIVARAREVGR